MNFLSKFENLRIPNNVHSFLLILILTVFIARLISVSIFTYLPSSMQNYYNSGDLAAPISLNTISIFGIKDKQVPKTTKKPQQKQQKPKVKNIILKDFQLLATYISSSKNDFIMFLDKQKRSSHMLALEEEYEGYKLVEVKTEIAKFTKDGDFYWLFQDEELAKNYEFEKVQKDINSPSKKSKQDITVSKKSDEGINFKDGVYYIPRPKIQEFNNINKIFKQIAISPHYENGKLTGFIVSNIKPTSVFTTLGLKKNDKIIEVNHNPLTKMEDGFYYFSQLNKINSMVLTIMRNDIQKELIYEIF